MRDGQFARDNRVTINVDFRFVPSSCSKHGGDLVPVSLYIRKTLDRLIGDHDAGEFRVEMRLELRWIPAVGCFFIEVFHLKKGLTVGRLSVLFRRILSDGFRWRGGRTRRRFLRQGAGVPKR